MIWRPEFGKLYVRVHACMRARAREHTYKMKLTKSAVVQTSFCFLPVACNKVRKYDPNCFFQSWQFVKMFIGKLLCGVERGIWRRLLGSISAGCQIAWLRIIKPQPVPNDPDIWAMRTWEKSNVLYLIADEQELTTANFIIFEIKGDVQ